jgi:hypothetical protein
VCSPSCYSLVLAAVRLAVADAQARWEDAQPLLGKIKHYACPELSVCCKQFRINIFGKLGIFRLRLWLFPFSKI